MDIQFNSRPTCQCLCCTELCCRRCLSPKETSPSSNPRGHPYALLCDFTQKRKKPGHRLPPQLRLSLSFPPPPHPLAPGMGLLSNRIGRESLKAGDHVYSWRAVWAYAHHGIYVGDDKVVHFTRGRGQEVGTGTVLDLLLASSGSKGSEAPCPVCSSEVGAETSGVVSSCLNCFLAGGALYRFEYGVNPALFLAKARGGTCTLAVADPDQVVVRRANHLLSNGFRCYNLFKNNCEDFAIYCKTGLLVAEQGVIGHSGQAISIVGGPLAAALSTPFRLVTTNVYGIAVTAVGVYCASRYAADIGNRRDVLKVEAEDLTAGLATGRLHTVENISQLVVPAQC